MAQAESPLACMAGASQAPSAPRPVSTTRWGPIQFAFLARHRLRQRFAGNDLDGLRDVQAAHLVDGQGAESPFPRRTEGNRSLLPRHQHVAEAGVDLLIIDAGVGPNAALRST